MLHLIPAPLHRLGLRVAHRLRRYFRKIIKPDLSGVAVLLRDDQGRVLLVRHSYGPKDWAMPGGGLGRGEDPADCARREMREELNCELEALELLASFDEHLSGAQHTGYIYTALVRDEVRIDGREIVEARWFAAHELTTITCTRMTFKRLKKLGLYNSES